MKKDVTEKRKGSSKGNIGENIKKNSKKKRVIRFFVTAAAVGTLFWLSYFVERGIDEDDSIWFK